MCAIFVSALGDPVVQRAEVFFDALAKRGRLTSVDAKELLRLPNQRSIGANLTISLRKRVNALRLNDEPFTKTATADGERTLWIDRDGIAARMHAATSAEIDRRGLNHLSPGV